MRITKNFSLSEFEASNKAKQIGIYCCMQDTIDAVADVTIECPKTPVEVFA